MPRPALYSSSRTTRRRAPEGAASSVFLPGAALGDVLSDANKASTTPPEAPAPNSPATTSPSLVLQLRALWALVLVLALLLATSLWLQQRPAAAHITQKDIDAAVLHTLETTVPPSAAARAVEAVAPSVVRVIGFGRSKNGKDEVERGVGTGVVIIDKGTILTNLHVVNGASRIGLTFYDGLETTAHVIGIQADNDLAVLQADKVPDDLEAATLRSTQDLRTGDQVVAVGFPFGIGPSSSAGIVSGLQREFSSPEGKRQLSNLIQFDAAANPGNSGGPLITMDGAVVGIVTAILNPTPARTFIGIGFAVPIENAASAVGMPPF